MQSAPPIEVLYRHRAAHSVVSNGCLPEPICCKLFSSFLEWCEADDESRGVTPEIVLAATNLFDGPPPDRSDARWHAALRMELLWRVYRDLMETSSQPLEANLPYIFGVLLDSHVDLVLSYTDNTELILPYELYSARLSPFHTSKTVIQKLLPDCFSDHKNDEAPIISIDDLDVLWKIRPQSTPLPSVMAEFLKLLQKGQPRPVSIRYILANIKKLLLRPTPNPYAMAVLSRFAVGGWKHCTVIAPPAVRLRIYNPRTGPQKLVEMLMPIKSTLLYTILAETLCATTKHHPPLHRALKSDGSIWSSYEDQAFQVADKQVRKSLFFSHERSTKLPSIQTVHSCVATATTVFVAMITALGCDKPKIPAKVTLSIQSPIGKIYEVLRESPTELRLHLPTLRAIGIPESELGMLQAQLTDPKKEKLQRIVNKTLHQLSKQSFGLLYLYVNYVYIRASLLTLPIATTTTQTEKADRSSSNALVCRECFTIRSQSRGDFERRSKEGVLLDIETHAIYCTSCYSGSIDIVDTKTNLVFGYGVNSPSEKHCYTACCVCGETTKIDDKIIGTQPVCGRCFESVTALSIPTRCLCGAERTAASRTITVAKSDGSHKLVALCGHHAKSAGILLGPNTIASLEAIQTITAV